MECPERIRDLGTRVTVQRFETGEVGFSRVGDDVGDSSSPYAQGKHRPAGGCHAPERKPGSRPGPHLDQNVLARCAAVAPASILGPLETRAGTNDEIMPAWPRQTGD